MKVALLFLSTVKAGTSLRFPLPVAGHLLGNDVGHQHQVLFGDIDHLDGRLEAAAVRQDLFQGVVVLVDLFGNSLIESVLGQDPFQILRQLDKIGKEVELLLR